MEVTKKYIDELIDNGVFEIWYPGIDSMDNKYSGNVYIPYMMNDAMECYIELTNASVVGVYNRDLMCDTNINFHRGEKNSLIVRQGEDNTCTIWYEEAIFNKKYYRFHEICHMWEPGQEQWSQLVYIIGTMYDKYAFNGSDSCNKEEIGLMKLVEFEPFRNLAPAKQLFEELYDNTRTGAKLMKKLSFEAGDWFYGILCGIYGMIPVKFFGKLMTGLLTKPNRYYLYKFIYEKATYAASKYPQRIYGDSTGDEIINSRKEVEEFMKNNDFKGSYPDYSRNNIYVRVVEEQPFTIMDWEDIVYKQNFMVSVVDEKISKKFENDCYNLGFFEGRGLANKILDKKGFFMEVQR